MENIFFIVYCESWCIRKEFVKTITMQGFTLTSIIGVEKGECQSQWSVKCRLRALGQGAC